MRDQRLATYREFGVRRGWRVLGLHEDLSRRFPVAPLLGAASAQAELAFTGQWAQWSGLVASVLVQLGDRRGPRPQADLVVQLTVLDTGPLPWQFAAGSGSGVAELAELTGASPDDLQSVRAFLEAAGDRGDFRSDDRLAAGELSLVHARPLAGAARGVDVEQPLRLLSDLAAALTVP